MSEFTGRGKFQARDGWQQFETSVQADNENVAEERTYTNFGGRHGLKRTQVEVQEVVGQ
jgi:large subunit ribosomal protein LX